MTTGCDHGSELELRPLRSADIETLAPGCDDLFKADAWTEHAVAETLATRGAFGILASKTGKRVGLVVARMAADECEILWLVVASSHGHGGSGRALLDAALRQAAALGAMDAYLEVAVENRAALALYRAGGFHECGWRSFYYAGSMHRAACDALSMRCRLE